VTSLLSFPLACHPITISAADPRLGLLRFAPYTTCRVHEHPRRLLINKTTTLVSREYKLSLPTALPVGPFATVLPTPESRPGSGSIVPSRHDEASSPATGPSPAIGLTVVSFGRLCPVDRLPSASPRCWRFHRPIAVSLLSPAERHGQPHTDRNAANPEVSFMQLAVDSRHPRSSPTRTPSAENLESAASSQPTHCRARISRLPDDLPRT